MDMARAGVRVRGRGGRDGAEGVMAEQVKSATPLGSETESVITTALPSDSVDADGDGADDAEGEMRCLQHT